jgi:hypothetical protein
MIWGSLPYDEDGHLSMRASHLPYCYWEHLRGRVVGYAIRNLDGDPYASGERGLSGGAGGAQGQVKMWVLVVLLFSLTLQIKSITRLPVDLIASTWHQRWQVVCLSSLVASVQMSGMVGRFRQVER